MAEPSKSQDLPRDNASRLALYDSFFTNGNAAGPSELTEAELFEEVIGRLRILVPRELHLTGDRAYVAEKIAACIESGMIQETSNDGQPVLTLTGQPPQVSYPDGQIRDYRSGLEPARERLERDNASLRMAGFDVRKLIGSIADNRDGREYQALLASMREHGFMKQFPVVQYDDGAVVDGLARVAAAEELQVEVEYLKRATSHRATPLARILLAIDSNFGRLDDEAVLGVQDGVSRVTGRPWEETAADLQLTADWRRSSPAEYSPWFDVKKFAYRKGDEPRIQVTADGRVMLRSLIEAGGLSNYKIDMLRNHVPFERARSTFSAGRKAVFARAEDLIVGIPAMQQERAAARLKTDPEWNQIHEWLLRSFRSARDKRSDRND